VPVEKTPQTLYAACMSSRKNALLLAGAVLFGFTLGAATNAPYHQLLSLKQEVSPATRDYSVVNAFPVRRDNLFIGDSVFANVEWSDAFPDRSIANRSVAGDTTEGMRSRIAAALQTRPKVVFITGGLNDPSSGVALERTKANYAAMVDAVRDAGAKVVIVAVPLPASDPEIRAFIVELNGWLAGYAAESGVGFVDLNSTLATAEGLKPEYRLEDGMHPNGAAYRLLAGRLAQFVA
jgi:lysophospholipase L1-like esterase